MTDKFDRLITVLDQELKLTGTEIAEILWLAMQRQPHLSRETRITPSEEETPISVTQEEEEVRKSELGTEETPDTKDNNKISQTPSSQQETTTTEPKNKDSKEVPHAEVYPKTLSISLNKDSFPTKVPGASSLRHPLNIARALRPLIRYISAGKAVLLDEEATVELIAELKGICIPVLKAPLELQFDLALVVDESDSMIFWRETTQELQKFFKHYGIFRNLQTWGMVKDEKGNVRLRQRIGKKNHSRYRYSPQKLIDPSGRRLILVVSDCVSEIWRNGQAFSLFEGWGKHNVAAIVQILPERMWLRTSLSLGAMVQLDCFKPTVSNRNLFVKEILLWNDVDLKTGIKVPVFSLETDLVETWSEMVVKRGNIGAGGFVFSASSKEEQMPLIEDADKEKLTSEERVYNFQMSSSQIAQNLANLLAAAPVINLPIVRLIQKNLLRQSQQVHVAEVFLGGILKPQTKITLDIDPNEVQYHFIDEKIRDILLKESPRIDSKEIITIISEDFAKRLGKSPKEFYALLKKPDELEDELEKLPEKEKIKHFDVKHFAKINTKVLKRLGGAYAHFAQEIEDAWQERGKTTVKKHPDKLKDLEEHYDSLIKAIKRGRMIPFLGSDINLCDRPIEGNGELESWKPDSPYPPSGKELAIYLAENFPPPPPVPVKKIICPLCEKDTERKPGKVPKECPLTLHANTILVCPQSSESLIVRGENLAYLSQYAYLTDPSEFYNQLQLLKLASQPNQLHKFFATLPSIMREKGYYQDKKLEYPLIVTSNYDCALERAFEKAKEPFDLVFYSNALDAEKEDRFVHRTPEGRFHKIENPNEYNDLSFKERTVILKLY